MSFFVALGLRRVYKKRILMEDPTVIIVVAIVALLLAVAGFIYWRNRPPPEEEMLHFNCPSCGRRLRYKPKQAGHQGACPRCRETFLFPGGPKPSTSR